MLWPRASERAAPGQHNKKRHAGMAKRISILNGPNLNLLGQREPDIYGHETLDDLAARCQALAMELGLEASWFQSNFEGALIDQIHRDCDGSDGIVINPAAFTHTSVVLLDALKIFPGPVLEVHISNIHQREDFRHQSYVSLRAEGVIAGFGVHGYELAVRHMAELLR